MGASCETRQEGRIFRSRENKCPRREAVRRGHAQGKGIEAKLFTLNRFREQGSDGGALPRGPALEPV